MFSARLLAAAAPALFVLTACGGGDEGASTTTAGGTPPTASSAPVEVSKADAEAADGTITATLDGEARTWYVTSGELGGEFNSQSDWSGSTTYTSVSLFGHTTPKTTMSSKNAMLVGFTVSGDNQTVSMPSVSLLTDSLLRRYEGEGSDVTVALEEMSVDGEWLHLKGTFSGTLTYTDSSGATKDPVTVTDGTFDLRVHD
ncbi:hypothetical protein [Parvularcula marina]|uniref:Lipoprotein n=1 Tax=Parvularcula marina TaxID=2292771 RepID=A0A371RHN5_9PROT|nr:hypothetical protein [Parvularcula marina]RFB04964.1 hypothetical protein DX908_06485 [Parvularcula marina]